MSLCTSLAGTCSLIALSCACSETLSPPGAKTVDPAGARSATKADVSPCDDVQAWRDALGALPAAAVQHVEPTYMRDTCSGTAQVTGTTLALAPSAVGSEPWARLAECAGARVHFPEASASAQAPLGSLTPEGWLEITVEHEHQNVVLTLHADSIAKNVRLFRHAVAFARATRE